MTCEGAKVPSCSPEPRTADKPDGPGLLAAAAAGERLAVRVLLGVLGVLPPAGGAAAAALPAALPAAVAAAAAEVPALRPAGHGGEGAVPSSGPDDAAQARFRPCVGGWSGGGCAGWRQKSI
eukprot:SAG22_NODE_1366_length_4595_cov_5.475979_3_plen_122_part_00